MRRFIIALLLITFVMPWLYINLFSKEIKIGGKAPNIILRDIDNKLVISRKILKKMPIVISFFFTACVPCRKEIPELDRLNKKYDNKIKMFLISTDKEGADAVIPYIKDLDISIKVLIDKYSDIASSYNIVKYPTTFVIDKKGKVTYYCAGYKKENIIKLEKIIKKFR